MYFFFKLDIICKLWLGTVYETPFESRSIFNEHILQRAAALQTTLINSFIWSGEEEEANRSSDIDFSNRLPIVQIATLCVHYSVQFSFLTLWSSCKYNIWAEIRMEKLSFNKIINNKRIRQYTLTNMMLITWSEVPFALIPLGLNWRAFIFAFLPICSISTKW